MRAIVTGQVGMDKKGFLQRAGKMAQSRDVNITLCNVGQMMYGEGSDIKPGKILDLPLSRLTAMRRAVFKDIISQTKNNTAKCNNKKPHLVVNTHATFRWRHGLFGSLDFDQIKILDPDVFICLVDNIEVVHQRLHSEHTVDATFKDLMVWREEEILATKMLAQALGKQDHFFILPRGRGQENLDTFIKLVTDPQERKVYPSFPMTHVAGMPQVLSEINHFRRELSQQFMTFDPADVDEKLLLESAMSAARASEDFIDTTVNDPSSGKTSTFPVSVKQVLDIAGDIDGQIYMRDFSLIDQSDMIVSLIPELEDGRPGLSSGVERELQHAFEHGKDVFVIWKPNCSPSPFITETATKIFANVEEALKYFKPV